MNFVKPEIPVISNLSFQENGSLTCLSKLILVSYELIVAFSEYYSEEFNEISFHIAHEPLSVGT